MVYTGFCEKQNKNYSVEYETINTNAIEDLKDCNVSGRLDCVYAGVTGCCSHPSQCSILQNATK